MMCTRNVLTVFIMFFLTGLFFTGCENPVQTRGPSGTKYALVMEGGGVRGIIAAQFLALLEEQVLNSLGEDRNTTPEFFDLISGSSIGGIHALFLAIDESQASPKLQELLKDEKGAPLGISGASLLNLYTKDEEELREPFKNNETAKNNIKKIFTLNPSKDGLPTGYGLFTAITSLKSFLGVDKSNAFLEGAIQGVIYTGKGPLLKELFGENLEFGSLVKPVFIPTYDYANHEPRYFSSYDSSDKSVKAWELAEATSAAPIYFPPITVTKGEEKMFLMDGTLMSNNTCISVHKELAEQFPNDYVKILSVSSGHFVEKMIDKIKRETSGISDKKAKEEEKVEAEKKRDAVSWVLGGGKLIERLVSVPSFLSTSTCKRLLGDNFMHIDFKNVAITDIDDIELKTLKGLREDTKEEFKKIKDDLKTFLLSDTL